MVTEYLLVVFTRTCIKTNFPESSVTPNSRPQVSLLTVPRLFPASLYCRPLSACFLQVLGPVLLATFSVKLPCYVLGESLQWSCSDPAASLLHTWEHS